MKIQLRQLVPSVLELAGGAFAALAIILLANTKGLLSYYGLQSSNDLIKSDAGTTVTHGLKTIDSFGATNGVVTFLIWAIVGILCFTLVEAMGNTYQQMKLSRQVSSRNYIQPVSFSKARFWRGIVLDMCTLLFGLVVLGVIIILFTILLLPLGLAYSRVFLFDISIGNVLYMIIGLLVILVGLLVTDSVVRFLLHRRRIVSLG